MIYTLAIDWLSLHCCYTMGDDWQPIDGGGGGLFDAYPFKYRIAQYSTRQFSQLHFVSMPNPEGGWDDFAEVQSHPFSGILKKNSIIVRFVNRVLYTPDFWELLDKFIADNHFQIQGISRIDICADFNQFECIAPLALIEGFAAKKYRHIGRGAGALYFDHGVKRDIYSGNKDYGVQYTGLSFGTHGSDAHVYLYNKSKELREVQDKPYIRDLWKKAGLDERNVWRLEISIKSKGCKFKDKTTGKQIDISRDNSADLSELARIYQTFVRKLFSFVPNRKGITNITHEFKKNGLQLFSNAPCYDRGVIRNISSSNRADRMIIKALWLLGDTYRGFSNIESADLAQSFAINIAESTDLTHWMSKHMDEWKQPTHK